MNDLYRCNKVSGIYWLRKPIENVKIKIKIKPQDGILSLPKFEEYTHESNSVNLQNLDNNSVQEHTFKWQKKIFSLWEINCYTDVHNCISETELNYHNMIEDSELEPHKIFTYIHEDHYLPVPVISKKKKSNVSHLHSCLEHLSLNDKAGRFAADTSSMGHLLRSEENIAEEKEQWIAMHIVLDNSDYNENSQLLLKQEAILLSLYHNTTSNCLVISPDVNNLDLNPYTVETATGVRWAFQYSIDVNFGDGVDGDELAVLLNKLFRKWEKRQKQLVNFTMPPLGKKQYNVALEILTATNFDADNLYIEFHIKVPDEIHCTSSLKGRTHISQVLRSGDVEEWCFGHVIDLELEVDAGSDPPPIQIFLEAISTDWLGRHRTEGYTYLALSLHPGRYKKRLSCSRPEELDVVEAEGRRFFVGGCHLIKELEVLAKPQLVDTNFRFVTTGTITVIYNTISQTAIPTTIKRPQPSSSSASALLLGAEAVLRQYRKARARLAAATKDLNKFEDKE